MSKKLLLLLAVLVAFPAVATAGKYEDKKYGFTITILKDWTQTPVQPNEKVEVAKFKDDRDRNFADLGIYRFQISGGAVATEDATGDVPGEEDLPRVPAGWGMPDNAKDYLQALVSRRARMMTGNKDWKLPKAKDVKFSKTLRGDIYIFEFESKRMRSSSTFHMAGIVRNDSEEFLIFYSTPKNRAKKLKGPFLSSIRSFRFGDGEVEEDDGARGKIWGCKPEDLLGVEKRNKIKENLVGSWRYIDTRHYIIIFNCDVRLAMFIARRMEYMREFAYERVFPPVEPIKEAMVVRVCKEMDEYYHYGAPRGSAGYWASMDDELVFPDLAQSKKPDVKTVGVMAHEGFHQYIYYALLKHNPPVWFNEGYAEYFFCVNFKSWNEKKLQFDKRHPMRYSTVKSAVGTGEMIPIKDFIKMSQGQYYSKAQLCYSQGWAFATWLKNVTRNKRYQEIPKIFFQEMQKGYSEQARGAGDGGVPGLPPGIRGRRNQVTIDAMKKAFEGIDLDKLDKDFLKGVKRDM